MFECSVFVETDFELCSSTMAETKSLFLKSTNCVSHFQAKKTKIMLLQILSYEA